jgi:hypothetical protein
MMATMHQKGCPLTSGRFVLWRTIPFLAISPILSTFIKSHDVLIYLIVLYTFLLLLLYQFRNLCHEWSTWISQIPIFKEEDICTWYDKTRPYGSDREKGGKGADGVNKSAVIAFREGVESYRLGLFKFRNRDDLVGKVAKALPLISWLLEKENQTNGSSHADSKPVKTFTRSWFAKLEQALERQQGLTRGLKEHSIFVLFRHGEYDVRTKFLQIFGPYEGNFLQH